jgi:DNA-binding HxlR family transcriptional regulator
MRRKSFGAMECSIARAVDEVCEPWTLLVLRHAFLGVRRFGDFEVALDIPPTTLTKRLADLTSKGLLERKQYEAHPVRYEYRLTDRALDLLPLIVSLAVWGGRWKSPSGPPFELVDATTGCALDPVLVDRRSGQPIVPGKVALALGSGASPGLRSAFRSTGKKRLVLGGAS